MEGKIWRSICEVAETLDAEPVVVGARGLSRVQSALLGGVSSAVVVHAQSPIGARYPDPPWPSLKGTFDPRNQGQWKRNIERCSGKCPLPGIEIGGTKTCLTQAESGEPAGDSALSHWLQGPSSLAPRRQRYLFPLHQAEQHQR